MKTVAIRMVRIYCTEGEHVMQKLFRHLHDEEKVTGVTVFRGIAGFGQSGQIHSASLIDLSLNLPIVIEFFDEDEKIKRILSHLKSELKPGHVVSWPAETNG
ncbi:MAG: DUF190 domain-containing protein [gamma proteobacterium symbiont of Bathyaustriella thionipta]|nr:DUF190 domain-containing protein [gamma proteobacterium symbiont of Bathyaustriella thionipta]